MPDLIRYGAGCLVALVLVGCSQTSSLSGDSSPEQFQADRKLAEVALTGGRPESAVEIYRRQLESQPDNTELLYLLGMAYNQNGEFELALHYLDRARLAELASQLPVRGEIFRESGRAKLALGQVTDALADLELAVSVLPNNAEAMNSLGVGYALSTQYSHARKAFISALALEPGSSEYRNNLALSWILDDHPQKGIDLLYPAYLRGESTVKIRQNLALAFAMKGDINAAKTIARQDLTKAELDNNITYYQQWHKVAE